MFEYRGKVSKQLVLAFAEPVSKQKLPPLQNSKGVITRDIKEKLEKFKEYYQKLYTTENKSCKKIYKFLGALELSMITEEHVKIFYDSISLEKTVEAVKKLKLNTSPGA